jgi:tRNA pseudouridine65 synthase
MDICMIWCNNAAMQLRILYQDERIVAVDKPSGFHVHPPEDERHRIARGSNCLFLLRRQIGSYLYPVHRLDGATSGVLLFALDGEAAAALQQQFQNREITKIYFAMVRGWTDAEGRIESPLSGAESVTHFTRIATTELPVAVGRYPSTRYSLVHVRPETGRMHQIRRHFEHLRHPLIGDSTYGDGPHNRFFKERIPGSSLFLKAHSIAFTHPSTRKMIRLKAPWNHVWHQAFEMFGVCPFTPPACS